MTGEFWAEILRQERGDWRGWSGGEGWVRPAGASGRMIRLRIGDCRRLRTEAGRVEGVHEALPGSAAADPVNRLGQKKQIPDW